MGREHEHVSVMNLGEMTWDGEDPRFAAREEFEPQADHNVTLETVRKALSRIPGALDADFLNQRN